MCHTVVNLQIFFSVDLRESVRKYESIGKHMKIRYNSTLPCAIPMEPPLFGTENEWNTKNLTKFQKKTTTSKIKCFRVRVEFPGGIYVKTLNCRNDHCN